MPTTSRRTGAYAKLLANYAEDDAVIEAGEKAELLFVRALAFCADSDSDGFITDRQIVRLVGVGMRDATKRAQKLAEVGLFLRENGGYVVRSWTKLHETAEQKNRRLKADRERKATPKPAITPDMLPIPDGIQDGIQEESEPIPNGDPPDSLSMTEQYTAPQNTAGQGGTQEGGNRNETFPPSDATDHPPPKPRDEPVCLKHPTGNLTGEPCTGCARVREHRDKAAERQAEKDRLAIEERRRNCPDCEGTGKVLDAQKNATSRKCDHLRRTG